MRQARRNIKPKFITIFLPKTVAFVELSRNDTRSAKTNGVQFEEKVSQTFVHFFCCSTLIHINVTVHNSLGSLLNISMRTNGTLLFSFRPILFAQYTLCLLQSNRSQIWALKCKKTTGCQPLLLSSPSFLTSTTSQTFQIIDFCVRIVKPMVFH